METWRCARCKSAYRPRGFPHVAKIAVRVSRAGWQLGWASAGRGGELRDLRERDLARVLPATVRVVPLDDLLERAREVPARRPGELAFGGGGVEREVARLGRVLA